MCKINKVLFRVLILVMVLVIYSVSLYFPAFGSTLNTAGSNIYSVFSGWRELVAGIFGFMFFCPAWLANFTFAVALVLYCFNVRLAKHVSFVTILVGLTSFSVLMSPNPSVHSHFYIGFYLWIVSFASLYGACLVNDAKCSNNRGNIDASATHEKIILIFCGLFVAYYSAIAILTFYA